MTDLVIQIQPGRLAAFREDSVEALCRTPAFAALVSDNCVNEGVDHVRYINVSFTTERIKDLWPLVRERLMDLGLQNAAIVTCTGKQGWDDYLLLHHFDRANPTDQLRGL